MNHRILSTACLLALCLGFTGCVHTGGYNWGGYEQSLYTYYKSPNTAPELQKTLEDALNEEIHAGRIAPGLFAELGMLHLDAGRTAEAKQCFEKELQYWPESAVMVSALMKGAHPQKSAGSGGQSK